DHPDATPREMPDDVEAPWIGEAAGRAERGGCSHRVASAEFREGTAGREADAPAHAAADDAVIDRAGAQQDDHPFRRAANVLDLSLDGRAAWQADAGDVAGRGHLRIHGAHPGAARC